jgi:hypothetical protein
LIPIRPGFFRASIDYFLEHSIDDGIDGTTLINGQVFNKTIILLLEIYILSHLSTMEPRGGKVNSVPGGWWGATDSFRKEGLRQDEGPGAWLKVSVILSGGSVGAKCL